jgi:hypothetical protein
MLTIYIFEVSRLSIFRCMVSCPSCKLEPHMTWADFVTHKSPAARGSGCAPLFLCHAEGSLEGFQTARQCVGAVQSVSMARQRLDQRGMG